MVNRKMLDEEISKIRNYQIEISSCLNKLSNYFDEL